MSTEAIKGTDAITWYGSKVDWWIALILCVPPLACIAVFTGILMNGKTSDLAWAIGPAMLILGVYFGLIFPMRYGVSDTHLHVRFGLCLRRIPLLDILEVYPTHNPLSSPALSLDRLHVQFGESFFKAVMISPADRDQFLSDLGKKAGLKREGDRLMRGESS